VGRRVILGALLSLLLLPSAASADPIRVDSLSSAPRDRIAIYIVRGPGVSTPLIAFQERARRLLEAHMHVEIVSMREALVRGGPDLNKKLGTCQADPDCYSQLLGRTLDARYLLVLTATRLDELRLAGARLLDLEALRILGESIGEVPSEQSYLDASDQRVQACVPQERWDPFGGLQVQADQAGAQVSVQGRVLGLTPMSQVGFLLPGTYEVGLRKSGFEPLKTEVQVQQGQVAQAVLQMQAIPEPESSSWMIWAGAGAAVAVAATVVTVVLVTSGGGDPSFCSAPDPMACM